MDVPGRAGPGQGPGVSDGRQHLLEVSIIAQLAAAEQDLSCGAIELPIKTSTATHHFTALRRAGVLHQYYAGTSRMNVLRRQDMERAFPGFLTSVIAAIMCEGHYSPTQGTSAPI